MNGNVKKCPPKLAYELQLLKEPSIQDCVKKSELKI
jgi:hypothetical protein